MLKDLFPQSYGRHYARPLLGAHLDDFDFWLVQQGYQLTSRVCCLRSVGRIDAYLRKLGVQHLSELTHDALTACWARFRRQSPSVAGNVHALQRFLEARRILLPRIESPTRTSTKLSAYADHLRDVRGYGQSAVRNHLPTAKQFLDHLCYETAPSQLTAIAPSSIESFVRARGEQLARGSLQHTVAQIRSFLRFLAMTGDIRPGLDAQIDTPRLYRLEKLPRALPWDAVRKFLDSIDRKTPTGLRNYTMYFLMATYGLRTCEIVSITLDDINWRAGSVRIFPRKNRNPLFLPLTDDAGTVLLDYLRRGRPPSPLRQLFLKVRAPSGPLKRTAVGETFRSLAKRPGLEIPFTGPHCLRHSYAVHLLRQGTSLKTIGDLLGHRFADSTYAYLRFAVEDLRDVALPLPKEREGAQS